MIHFEVVTNVNRKEICGLKILEEQSTFVESVTDCLSEADARSCWRPVGIYQDTDLIGFAMYGFFWEYFPLGRLWLDRFLIDARFQGHGYGKAAFAALLKRLDGEYLHKSIYLSVTKGNTTAAHMYSGFGFRITGELDEHGEEVMLLSRKNRKPPFPSRPPVHKVPSA